MLKRSVLVGFLLAGCAVPQPKEPPLEGTLRVASGPCLGLCPEFSMEVDAEDRYRLNAKANTINPGRSSGGLPVGSFRRALDTLERYGFETMERSYTSATPETCPDVITGTPTLTVLRRTEEGRKIVDYEVGCLDFEGKDNLDQMMAQLYRILRINDLVAVGEPPKADDEQFQGR